MRLLFFLIFLLFSHSVFSEFVIECNERDRVEKLDLGKSGYVKYHYDENRLLEITRHTKEGDLLYTHAYEYDSLDHPIKEKLISDLGEITYRASNDSQNSTLVTTSPFHHKECIYNSQDQLLTHVENQVLGEYSYDQKNKLIHENYYQDVSYELDDLRRIVSQISQDGITQYQYNEKNQLISTIKPTCTVTYTYGDLGQRLSKTILKKQPTDHREILFYWQRNHRSNSIRKY